jgi:hypothetical protein
MIRATVLTALMDDYDTLKPVLPQEGADVDWVCFTDSVRLRDEAELGLLDGLRIHPTGWQIVYCDRPADVHPNRAAKAPKMQPRLFTDAPASVWVDASFRVVSPRFVADVVTIAGESEAGVAQFKHPWRDCLFDEADVSVTLPKYGLEADVIHYQKRAYDDAGMPRHWGLWATGVIARRHDDAVFKWGIDWGNEIVKRSYQDQISHPFTCWRHDLRPVDLPGDHFHNSWLAYEGSARHG